MRRALDLLVEKYFVSEWSESRTYQFLVNPFGTFSQKLEIRIGVDIQNIDQFSLQQCANVHPLFVNLLDSVKNQQKY